MKTNLLVYLEIITIIFKHTKNELRKLDFVIEKIVTFNWMQLYWIV